MPEVLLAEGISFVTHCLHCILRTISIPKISVKKERKANSEVIPFQFTVCLCPLLLFCYIVEYFVKRNLGYEIYEHADVLRYLAIELKRQTKEKSMVHEYFTYIRISSNHGNLWMDIGFIFVQR